ncbi:MAG: heavy-metal-associated domain-containing protein [Limnohabitans sp.]|jgi:copper chaperone
MNHTFQVQGMTCGHCEMAVKKAITRLDPAAKVSIDRPLEKVDVESDQPKDELIRVITDEGYVVV